MTFDFKQATAAQLTKECNRIALKTGGYQVFASTELNDLRDVLVEPEQILGFCSGFMDSTNWLIVLTDLRVLFLCRGAVGSSRHLSIDLNAVKAVSGESRFIFGKISIHDGAVERTIRQVAKDAVTPFMDLLRNALPLTHDDRRPSSPSAFRG